MYRTILKYDEGQDLALKCVWSVLQLGTEVAHDVFLILYSDLDGTDQGNKSIRDYCEQNDKMPIYKKLLDEGFPRDCFVVNPKEASYFDLKVIETLIKDIIDKKVKGKDKSNLAVIKNIMRDLVISRNMLCHGKLKPKEIDYIKGANEIRVNLKELYRVAGKIKGVGLERQIAEVDSTFTTLFPTPLPKTPKSSHFRSFFNPSRFRNIIVPENGRRSRGFDRDFAFAMFSIIFGLVFLNTFISVFDDSPLIGGTLVGMMVGLYFMTYIPVFPHRFCLPFLVAVVGVVVLVSPVFPHRLFLLFQLIVVGGVVLVSLW